MRCGFSRSVMFLVVILLLAAFSHVAATCSAATILIGDWRWGADGTVSPFNGQVAGNYAKDAYHGTAANGVTVGNGVLQVRTDPDATAPRSSANYYGDEFIRTGIIDELAGQSQMMWTFEDVTFFPKGASASGVSADYNEWYLAGFLKAAAFTDSQQLFWMGVKNYPNAATPYTRATMYLWDGTNNYVPTYFDVALLELQTQAYDFQFEFDGRDGPTDNVIFRMRDVGETTWTTELTGNNPVTRINTPSAWTNHDVAIGKNRPGSSTIGDMNMGRVTLHIPEPGAGLMCGLLLAVLAMFGRSRRR